MNKWMKAGVAGLILSAATLVGAQDMDKSTEAVLDPNSASDVAGGSKLKDRAIDAAEQEAIAFVRALIDQA